MQKLINLKLKVLARLIIRKYKPKVIGITGSVGKTGTKEAIYCVFKNKENFRASIKNYNNEIGVPLTIIGEKSAGKNIFKWVYIFLKATFLLVFNYRKYPKVLILEMGIDKPGDMDYLLDIVKPDIAVLTTIGTVHVENFGTKEKLQNEKIKLIEAVNQDGKVIVNFDNEVLRKAISKSKARVLTFGFKEGADLRAEALSFSFNEKQEENVKGLNFKLSNNDSFAPVFLNNCLSRPSVYSALAAAAVGITFDMGLIEISNVLKNYLPPKGRLNIIAGIKNTTIIDDTYNAEPDSMKVALETLEKIPVGPEARKIAVLGDMLELGSYSEEKHKEIGNMVAEFRINKLITIGERSIDIVHGALDKGMRQDDIFSFSNSDEAGLFVQKRMREGDLILVKGSQGVRTEKVVKEIMAEPLRAEELLVRQDEGWLS